jgi:hypothetical protein
MFYSKFSYRHYMAELLMYVTKFEPYVKSLQAYSMFFWIFIYFYFFGHMYMTKFEPHVKSLQAYSMFIFIFLI